MSLGVFFPDQLDAIRRAVDIVSADPELDGRSMAHRRQDVARIAFKIAQAKDAVKADDLVAAIRTELRRMSSATSGATAG
jgi:hypothetical protein